MDDMVERVLSLCPECDPADIERDLNITGDVEWTLNRALDGMLSPRSLSLGSANKTTPVTIVMDDDDDVVVMPMLSTFTNVKEKSETDSELNINMSDKLSSKFKKTAGHIGISKTKNNNNISFELSDSDSEVIDTSEICRKTLDKLKASITDLQASTSTTIKNITGTQSVPSSPDSDTELLRPVFDYDQGNNSLGKTSKLGGSSASVINANKNRHMTNSGMNNVPKVRDFRKNWETVDDDVCSEEPVKKKKRTKAEIDERKQEAMLKKAAKEKEREEKLEEKQRQKQTRAAALQEKKLQKEQDQLQRKAERLTKSANKLDGCLKFITAYLDPAFFPNGVADPDTNIILQKLSSMEANYAIAPQPYPGSVSWQRTTVQHSVQDGGLQITTSDCRKEEVEVLVVLSAEQFAEMVFSFKQGYVGGNTNLEERRETLVDFTKHVMNIYRGKKVTYLISGFEKYMRNVKLKQKRAFRTAAVGEPAEEDGTRKKRKKKTLPVLDVTRTDFEEALVDLQIKTNICVYHCETDEDLALKIAVFTKAVAERPFKKSLTDGIGFCLDRLVKTSLKVSKDGQGMVNVWQQQIQQFRNVSREMAAAIVAEYPSPQLLKQTYEECQSVQDQMLLLEDILVRRGGGSLATSRRIGPELSKRFYILFHSKENSDLVKG